MNPLKFIYQFLIDSKIKISHRAAIIITILFGLFIIDNILGFTFNYKARTQLEIIKKADELITNEKTDSITRVYAERIRDKVANRRNIFDYLSSRRSLKDSKPNTTITIPTATKNESTINKGFWFIMSTSGFFFIGMLFAVWVNLFWIGAKGNLVDRIGLTVIYLTLYAGIGYVLYFILGHLPILKGGIRINYFINLSLQIIVCLLIVHFNNSVNETRERAKENEAKLKEKLDANSN